MTITHLYTDGACSHNPGPGGWAYVLIYGKNSLEASGFVPNTTNNQMELQAVIEGLKRLKRPCVLQIHTDSKYIVDAFEKNWLDSWMSRGWKKADKKPVKNKEFWVELLEQLEKHEVTWNWVKGHSGHEQNERCDTLARMAIQQQNGIEERHKLC